MSGLCRSVLCHRWSARDGCVLFACDGQGHVCCKSVLVLIWKVPIMWAIWKVNAIIKSSHYGFIALGRDDTCQRQKHLVLWTDGLGLLIKNYSYHSSSAPWVPLRFTVLSLKLTVCISFGMCICICGGGVACMRLYEGMLLFLNVEISRGHQLPSSASGLFATEFAYPKHYCHNQNINFAYQIWYNASCSITVAILDVILTVKAR